MELKGRLLVCLWSLLLRIEATLTIIKSRISNEGTVDSYSFMNSTKAGVNI